MTNLGNKEILARNLLRYMNRDGLNVKELSEKLKTPYSTVADWTKANTYPRIDKLEMMANLFKIEKSDLIEDKEMVETKNPQRRFLMDKLETATDEEIDKLSRLWEIIKEEEQRNW